MLIIDQLKKGEYQLRLLAWMILLGLGVLASGLFYVQVVSGKSYQASQVNQSFRTVRLPAVRGRILDVNGVALAENRPAYNVNLYLEELRGHFQSAYRQVTLGRRLSGSERDALGRGVRYQVVSNLVALAGQAIQQSVAVDARRFRTHYNERLALPLTVAADLPLVSVARFLEGGVGLPGLELEVQPVRNYPYGSLAAHTIGYLRRDDRPGGEDFLTRYSLPDYRGVVGIEGEFDDHLRGRPGVKSVLVNNLGYRQSETVWEPAEAGDNVYLTLDARVQRSAEAALSSAGGDTRGAVVVMDVHTGDLLALASAPAFDPNEFVPRISQEKWDALMDPRLTPQIHRATAGIYAPGSIFKLVVAMAGLESGVLDPRRVYHSPGYYQLGTGPRARRIKDTANRGQPDDFDFRKALKLSSNAYFVHYGLLTGLDDIVAIGQRLHLGEKTGLPIGQEEAGDFPTPEWRAHQRRGLWQDGDTANLAMGQGYITVTPIQMAVMIGAVANGGTVLWPRLVDRVEPQEPGRSRDGYRIPSGRPRDHLGVSGRTLRTLREAMLADVEDDDGTGRRARLEGYRIAAKTGTAQVQKVGPWDHITWFAAFGPYEEPRYAVVVMIESGDSGGETCAPLARQVFEALRSLPETPVVTPAIARVD